ncbi:MAG: FHA domain-containing protein [Trichodesmium sp.]
MNVIRLTLLHPFQSMPVRTWTFADQPIIKIGRCSDNDVVLYSSVVSRYHVELRFNHRNWEIINLGSNGTYIDDKPITKVTLVNGLIINVAHSGPKIGIYLSDQSSGLKVKKNLNHNQNHGLEKFDLSRKCQQQELFEETKAEQVSE